jgi:hypothetical protein
MCWKCLRKYENVAPHTLWPQSLQRDIIHKTHANRGNRIRLVTFLYCNGITDEKDIMCIMKNKLRDKSAIMHINSIITSVKTPEYDRKWTYYSLQEKCILYLDGTIFADTSNQSTTNLKLAIWNRYCNKTYRSKHIHIKEQSDFFGENEEQCKHIHQIIQMK